MKSKKENLPYINPENRMNPKTLKEFINNKKKPNKPIIELDEKKIMPLHIFLGKFKTKTYPNELMDLMLTILHQKKTNKLKIRGRIRYETTQNKTVFQLPKNYNITELNKAKKEIKEFYEKIKKDLPIEESKPPTEINFEINERINQIIEKMNKSNEFNIGIEEK